MDLSTIPAIDLRLVIVPALAIMALAGLLAIVSPQHFASVSRASSQWIETRKFWDVLDRRFDVDRVALRYSRLFGVAVLAAALFLLWVYWTRILALPLPTLY